MTIDNFSSLEIQNTQTQGNTKRCQINQKVQLVLISEDKMYFQNSKFKILKEVPDKTITVFSGFPNTKYTNTDKRNTKKCQIKPLRKSQSAYFPASARTKCIF